MLSEEEKKAIEFLQKEYKKLIEEGNILFPLYKNQANIILNLITKLQKENEEKDRKMKKYLDIISKNIIETIKDELVQQKNKELDFKDKQIDLMAKQIEILNSTDNEQEDCFIPRNFSDINDCAKKKDCIACIKQYFETKAKKGE